MASELTLPCLLLPDCVIDAELVAIDSEGLPSFHALLKRRARVMAWAFDLLVLEGVDMRPTPLEERRARLQRLVAPLKLIRFSEAFSDPDLLLAAVDSRGLEGIVSKRLGQRYRSGTNPNWIKVKGPTWKERNTDRFQHRKSERS